MFSKTKAPPVKIPLSQPLQNFRSKFFFILSFFLLFCGCVTFVIQSLSTTQPSEGQPPTLYSNQLSQDLRFTLIEAIEKSNQSIHMVMFGLSDPAIIQALAFKKIPTVIYFDAKNSPNLWTKLPDAELRPIRGKGLMHQKIIILDQETTFLGSANMTTASLRMHDNLVIGIKNKKLAQFLINRTPHSSGYLQTTVGEQKVELWLLPDPRGYALEDVKRKIRQATKSLNIALFTFTHPALVEEVVQAHKRGVFVSVVIDMHSGLGSSREAIEKLTKAGVKVAMSRGVQLLHHKFILIDDQTLLSGSANWTRSAFSKNRDCFIILNNLTEQQKSGMKSLWMRIESESQVLESKSIHLAPTRSKTANVYLSESKTTPVLVKN